MKTLLFGLAALLMCWACTRQAQDGRPADGEALPVDTVMVDSLAMDSAEMRVLTRHIDRTFDDFIYAYAQDERIQLLRTRFPLPLSTDSTQVLITRDEWLHDRLYIDEEFYNMLFDKEEDMELEKATGTDRVYVAWLYLGRQVVRRYCFECTDGVWMLERIEERAFASDPNADFLSFFHHFCNDSVYQREHVRSPLKFITSDPDDDFRVIEASIDVGQWFAFRPTLPVDRMTNIHYGQPYDAGSRTKIVTFRSLGSGYSNTLFFTRRGGTWMLSAYEDVSN